MNKKALIQCVDDEPVNLAIMEELLQDRYALATADSGESCLRQAGEQTPDLILLDVNMPEVDGLETCRRLKNDPETADIPVIFVSALTTQEELMAGYEAGGDDYITKPFSEEILQKKIEVVLASQRRKQELKQMSDRAVAALMDNLGTTGELTLLVAFLHRCQAARGHEELARALFDCLGQFDLDCSLLLLDGCTNRVWFSDDIDRPMERQILESLRGQDRVLSFGTRIAVSSEHATLLVRNLAADDDAFERLRGRLAVLMEGLEARILALRSQALLEARREAMSGALDAGRENLDGLLDLQQRQRAQSEKIFARMRSRLDNKARGLDLQESVRDALLAIVSDAGAQIALLGEGQEAQKDALRAAFDELQRVLRDEI